MVTSNRTQIQQHIYYILKASKQDISTGTPHGHTQLSIVSRLMDLKVEHHFLERVYGELCHNLCKLRTK